MNLFDFYNESFLVDKENKFLKYIEEESINQLFIQIFVEFFQVYQQNDLSVLLTQYMQD